MSKTTNKTTEHLTNQFNSLLKTAKLSVSALRASELGKKLPDPEETFHIANEKLVASLKKLGLATREEVESLEARVAKLEEQLAAKKKKATTEAATATNPGEAH
jgi:polyhydroxyalkanoate synthesis regulator phasin